MYRPRLRKPKPKKLDGIQFEEDIVEQEVEVDGTVVVTPGSVPLDNPKHEAFAQFIFQGMTLRDAYKQAISNKCNDNTADGQASRMLNKLNPEIKVRVEWLTNRLDNMDLPTERKEAIKMCSDLMRDKNQPGMVRLNALDRLAKMNRWFEQAPSGSENETPDPAWFCRYLSRVRAQVQKAPPSEETASTEGTGTAPSP